MEPDDTYVEGLAPYLNCLDGKDKDEGRRLFALELLCLAEGPLIENWRTEVADIEIYLQTGKVPGAGRK